MPWSDRPDENGIPEKRRVKSITERALKVLDDTLAEYEQNIEQISRDLASTILEKEILHLLGIRQAWDGDFEWDHLNGRANPIHRQILHAAEDAGARYIAQILGDAEFEPSQKEKALLRKTYREAFLDEAERQVQQIAKFNAKEAIQRILNDSLPDKYYTTLLDMHLHKQNEDDFLEDEEDDENA